MTIERDEAQARENIKTYLRTGHKAALNTAADLTSLEFMKKEFWMPIRRSFQEYHKKTGNVLWNELGIYAPVADDKPDPLSSATQSGFKAQMTYWIYVGHCLGCTSYIQRFQAGLPIPDTNIVFPVRGSKTSAPIAYEGSGLFGFHEKCVLAIHCQMCRLIGVSPDPTYEEVTAWVASIRFCPECSREHPLYFKPQRPDTKAIREWRRRKT